MKRLMEKRRKKLAALCLAGCMVAVFGGCGSASKFSENAAADTAASVENYSVATQDAGGGYLTEAYDGYAVDEASVENGGTEVGEGAAVSDSARKLIKTVDLNVETKEFDLLMTTLEEQVNAMGGYIEQMDTYNGSAYSGYRRSRNASMTLRIPKDKLTGFLDTISEISNVVNRSEYVEDVTLAYVDVESRRNSLRTEQDRLLELLERAESIEDIITIEDRLSTVRYQLESMESQLRTYDNKVDYSTVNLYIDEVQELTPAAEETMWESISGGFMESLRNIGNGIKETAVWFAVHIPYIIIWGMVILIGVLLLKRFRRKRRERRQKNNMEQEKK